jgi:thiamine biosynthesis lipoprotein ApbE
VSHWSSVSVAAPNALAAGALATLGMLVGEQARAMLEAQVAWYLALEATDTSSPEQAARLQVQCGFLSSDLDLL